MRPTDINDLDYVKKLLDQSAMSECWLDEEGKFYIQINAKEPFRISRELAETLRDQDYVTWI